MEAAHALIEERVPGALVGEAQPSPAGPLEPEEAASLPSPPLIPLPRLIQVLRFNQRQIEFVFRARRELGEVFRMRGIVSGSPVITSHPDHVRSLFTAKPEDAPSLTGESPLRPIVGPNSVLTAVGPRDMRQATKALLAASTWRLSQVAELMNIGRDEPVGFTRAGLSILDRAAYAVI